MGFKPDSTPLSVQEISPCGEANQQTMPERSAPKLTFQGYQCRSHSLSSGGGDIAASQFSGYSWEQFRCYDVPVSRFLSVRSSKKIAMVFASEFRLFSSGKFFARKNTFTQKSESSTQARLSFCPLFKDSIVVVTTLSRSWPQAMTC